MKTCVLRSISVKLAKSKALRHTLNWMSCSLVYCVIRRTGKKELLLFTGFTNFHTGCVRLLAIPDLIPTCTKQACK